MKHVPRTLILLTTISSLLLFSGLTGCEDTSTVESLTITPDAATTEGVQSISFVAVAPEDTELLLPLEWSVVNTSLGRIIETSGAGAVYQSYDEIGQNVVSVKDPLGREALAVVSQTH